MRWVKFSVNLFIRGKEFHQNKGLAFLYSMDVTCPEEIHLFMSSLNTKPKPGMCCDLMFGPFGLTLLGLKMLFHFLSVAIGI